MDERARNNQVDGSAIPDREAEPSKSDVEAYARFRITLLNLTPAEVYAALRMLPEDRQYAVMEECSNAISVDRTNNEYQRRRAADDAAHEAYMEEQARQRASALASINTPDDAKPVPVAIGVDPRLVAGVGVVGAWDAGIISQWANDSVFTVNTPMPVPHQNQLTNEAMKMLLEEMQRTKAKPDAHQLEKAKRLRDSFRAGSGAFLNKIWNGPT